MNKNAQGIRKSDKEITDKELDSKVFIKSPVFKKDYHEIKTNNTISIKVLGYHGRREGEGVVRCDRLPLLSALPFLYITKILIFY